MPATTTLHHDRYATITEVPFTTFDGHPGKHLVVTTGTGGGAVIVPVANIRGINHYCLLTEYRLPVGKAVTAFPCGGTEPAETPEQTARRELAEETGIISASLVHLGTIHPDTGILDTEVEVFFAQTAHIPQGHVDAETGGTCTWVPEGVLARMLHAGELTCGISLAALALVQNSGRLR